MRSYTREVIKLLERYGAENVRYIPRQGRSPHPRLTLLWNGIEHTEVISGTPSDGKFGKQILRSIKRTLGPIKTEQHMLDPLVTGDRVIDTIPRMQTNLQTPKAPMSTTNIEKNVIAEGFGACHSNRVIFEIPDDIINVTGTGPFVIKQAEQTWEIEPHQIGPRAHKYKDTKENYHKLEQRIVNKEDTLLSGRTSALFLYDATTRVISVELLSIKAPKQKRRYAAAAALEQVNATIVNAATAQETLPTPHFEAPVMPTMPEQAPVTREMLQTALRILRHIEAKSDYKLIKQEERWVFSSIVDVL